MSHASMSCASMSRASMYSAQISDQVGALAGILQADIGHDRVRHNGGWACQVAVEWRLVPGQAGILVGDRIVEIRHLPCRPSDDTRQAGSNDRVAGLD